VLVVVAVLVVQGQMARRLSAVLAVLQAQTITQAQQFHIQAAAVVVELELVAQAALTQVMVQQLEQVVLQLLIVVVAAADLAHLARQVVQVAAAKLLFNI
jgi:hypothetical protein